MHVDHTYHRRVFNIKNSSMNTPSDKGGSTSRAIKTVTQKIYTTLNA